MNQILKTYWKITPIGLTKQRQEYERWRVKMKKSFFQWSEKKEEDLGLAPSANTCLESMSSLNPQNPRRNAQHLDS